MIVFRADEIAASCKGVIRNDKTRRPLDFARGDRRCYSYLPQERKAIDDFTEIAVNRAEVRFVKEKRAYSTRFISGFARQKFP